MVKSLKSFLNISILLLVIGHTSCKRSISTTLYKKEFSDIEKVELAESLLNGAGTDLYYQGTVSERMIIKEAGRLNPHNATYYREMGVPYLKRGFAEKADYWYKQAAKLDPLNWLGYKAYCWLYFYRDYNTALEEFNTLDPMTPDFVDYPMATSIDYMRSICYLKLGNYAKAIELLKKHIDKEKNDVGAEYIGQMPFLLLSLAHYNNEEYIKSKGILEEGIKYNKGVADLWFYYSKTLLQLGEKQDAKIAALKAQDFYDKGSFNKRPYVEEFYAIYQEDLDELRNSF